jgi:hypothetical protein
MYHNLYHITQDQKYLKIGTTILDYLSLFQQVWSPPQLDVLLIGGFGCANIDGEWSDVRQSCFAPVYAEYYKETMREDHLFRAILAMQASFPLILTAENKKIAPGNMRLIKKEDYGVAFENYGHMGWDIGTLSLTTVDWGIGTAFFGAAYIRMLIGDIYLEFNMKKAYLINAGEIQEKIFVENLVKLIIKCPLSKLPYKIKGKGTYSSYFIQINNQEKNCSDSELEEGIDWIMKK